MALIKGIYRYLNLFGLLMKIGLLRQMAYRFNFCMMIGGKLIRMTLLFFFYQAIFSKVSRIGQWGYDDVLLLFATFHLVDYLMSITFQRNLAFLLPRRIQSGELDARMVLPVNLLFLAALEDIDMIDFFSFIPSLSFLVYVICRMQLTFTWLQLLLYLVLIVNALVFLFAVVLAIAAISFWTTQSQGIAKIFDNLLRISRYPLDIFEGFWRTLFIYILPLVLVAQLPSQALLKAISPLAVLAALAGSGLFLIAALILWKAGLRTYTSASS
jgi:ABC-2 type transport system permease protein